MLLDSQRIKLLASDIGFSACGLTQARPVSQERTAAVRQWLAEGCHAGMDYLERNAELMADPTKLVPGARTIVSLAVNYFTPDNPNEGFAQPKSDEKGDFQAPSPDGMGKNAWKIARYARGTDYHDVVKNMLRRLMYELHLEDGTDGRCFVDTAPIDEKYWAQQCGLGWKGRNSQLIIPGAGSYFFLGELVLLYEADHYDEPMESHCGSCHRCLDACPAQALRGDGELDARRCLSYLTIEHRGDLPEGTGEQMGSCFYGCDRCNDCCPWNQRFASPTTITELQPRPALLAMTPTEWMQLDVERYRELFRKSAVKRAKFEGLTRNIRAISHSPQSQ